MNYITIPGFIKLPDTITPEAAIRQILVRKFNTSVEQICIRNRKREIVSLRQCIQVCLIRNTRLTLIEIGVMTGKHDYATVINSRRKVEEMEYLKKKFNRDSELLTLYKSFESAYIELMTENNIKVVRHYRSEKDERKNYVACTK